MYPNVLIQKQCIVTRCGRMLQAYKTTVMDIPQVHLDQSTIRMKPV
jgi:hypothetical protein